MISILNTAQLLYICNVRAAAAGSVAKTGIKQLSVMKSIMSILIASILCLFTGSCKGQRFDNSTVKAFDLDRYLGSWYEIARFDHSFERGLTHAKAYYSLNDDGTITVINSGMKKGKSKVSTGRAKTTDKTGLLRVSFFGPFYSDYRVMMLSWDYNYVLVGSGKPKYLWILSRTPDVPGEVLDHILDEASARGYDTNNLIWVDHSSDLKADEE